MLRTSRVASTLAPVLVSMTALLGGCERGTEPSAARSESAPVVSASGSAAASANAPVVPVSVETVPVAGDVPAFVLRGARGPAAMVFLHGMCVHGLGYVQAFASAAASRGTVIGLAGDVSCGGPWRMWGPDVAGLDRRIEEAFRAAGRPLEPGEEVVAMGYSQGATRAEALAARFPGRYTRVVLMGGPTAPSVARLRGVKSAVMMAGERDRQDLMKAGARALTAAGVPATYIAFPGAAHGSMGSQPGDAERVMEQAFAWLWPEAPAAR